MESSSSGGGTCAVLSELGFCTLSVDVSGFCSGFFEGIETTGVGTRGVEGPSQVLPLRVVMALHASQRVSYGLDLEDSLPTLDSIEVVPYLAKFGLHLRERKEKAKA
ncbi:hypothetical protein Tco_0099353 [Tanacetum coccineum]